MTRWYLVEMLIAGEENGQAFEVPSDRAIVVSERMIAALRAWIAAQRPTHRIGGETLLGTDGVAFDLPGMWTCGQPITSVTFADLAVDLPCADVRALIGMIEHAPEEDLAGSPCYSAAGSARWLVLAPEEREAAIATLKAIDADACEQARAFFDDKLTPAEALRVVAGIVDGNTGGAPSLGGRDYKEFL